MHCQLRAASDFENSGQSRGCGARGWPFSFCRCWLRTAGMATQRTDHNPRNRKMKNALLNALAWLTGASKTLLAFVLPILRDSTATLLTSLLPIALEVVASLADSPKSGEEKRVAAVDQIKAAAISAGIQASARAVNLAIELAVQKLEEGK